jgi:hypothetical protein
MVQQGQSDEAEYKTRLTKFANQLALKRPDLNLLRGHPREEYPVLTESLEHLLKERDAQGKLVLPNLAAFNNDAVGIFSDYSGESSGNYMTYSVLVCGYNFISAFSEKMKVIRQRYGLAEKEIGFKSFGTGQVQACLTDFLAAADTLPGFLCTVAVDKRIATLFGPHDKPQHEKLAQALEENGLGGRKPREVEKLLRIVHMSAFLAALLAHNGQKIFWMSDNDSICANPAQHHSMLELFERVLPIYARPEVHFPLLGGALPFQPRSVEMNDLLSIADVYAGSVAQHLSKSDTQKKEEIVLKAGAEKVMCSLAGDGIGLKKATFLLRLNPQRVVERGHLEVSLVNPPAEIMFIPIFE